ncbi:hypothetical protein PVAP13_6NG211100 [Panicum virgatum]|uniref:Uncharacterized protein n=1 Tax=Panicum virgatum TaxID=38727 RepID=A0A8T0QZ40_PANVG|nr:hypothetical protein PVAP13_6NG211100 [Panicum virgatum]
MHPPRESICPEPSSCQARLPCTRGDVVAVLCRWPPPLLTRLALVPRGPYCAPCATTRRTSTSTSAIAVARLVVRPSLPTRPRLPCCCDWKHCRRPASRRRTQAEFAASSTSRASLMRPPSPRHHLRIIARGAPRHGAGTPEPPSTVAARCGVVAFEPLGYKKGMQYESFEDQDFQEQVLKTLSSYYMDLSN